MREKITLSDIQNSSIDMERRHTGGEMSDVTILDKKGLVVKYSKQAAGEARHAILREALVVAELERLDTPPVEIPGLLECVLTPTPYAVFSLVPGETLEPERIGLFSREEKRALGRKMGELAAWMTKAMSFETYEQILCETDKFVAPNRPAILGRIKLGLWSSPTVRPQTAALVHELLSMHQALKSRGKLNPTMIGHNDLHPGNLVFRGEYSDRRLEGVIDFGVMQPSTPECELRHAATLGREVANSAIGEFEQRTKIPIDRSLLGFWALTQAVPGCFYSEMRTTELTGRHAIVERLLVEYGDAVGLESRDFSYSN